MGDAASVLGNHSLASHDQSVARASKTLRLAFSRRRAKSWVLEPLESRAMLSTIVVSSTADAGHGTLRAVIEQANRVLAPVTINFSACLAGRITLTSALPNLSNTTGVMDIEGPGASRLTVARSGGLGTPDFGIFKVKRGVDARIAGLTISGGSGDKEDIGFGDVQKLGGGILNNGTLTVVSTTITDNSAGLGGGIANQGLNPLGPPNASLTLKNCTIVGNSTVPRPGAPPGGGFGGGVSNFHGTVTIINSRINKNSSLAGGGIDNEGTLTVTHSRLARNSSTFGGGIFNNGTLTVTSSTIASNAASGAGGGIDNEGMPTATATVTKCTITHNSSSLGGGIDNYYGTLTVVNSTLAFDSAAQGGGIANAAPNLVNMLTVVNSTLADDSATSGGGIYNDDGGTLTAVNDTIAFNSVGSGANGGGLDVKAGTATLDNTIVALNTQSSGSGASSSDIAGALSSSSAFNLIGVGGAGGLTNGTDGNQVGVTNPGLGLLASNGGPTQTIALLAGSPAINVATPSPYVTTDQRGIRRPQGPAPDIGAFELELATEVQSVQRHGVHFQPTLIAVTFSVPMDKNRAQSLARYRIEPFRWPSHLMKP
jgi:hypothetical protein